jgi:ABC-type glycerol-3-phosphate transport system substrate-binding protein
MSDYTIGKKATVSRRQMLKLLGVGAASAGLAACAGGGAAPAPAAPAAPAADQPAPTTAPAAPGEVTLEVKSIQPEYSAQTKQILDVYAEQNPGVKFTITDVNEDTQAAYDARIAAGNPADMDCQGACTKANYQQYVNLLDMPEFKWDIFHKDAKTAFETIYGVPNYVPMVNPFQGYFFTWIFYKDKMAEAGLDPKATVKTMEDQDKFLADLKKFVDGSGGKYAYVFDTGWHPWVLGTAFPSGMATGLDQGKKKQQDLFLGKIKFTDMENNPFVPWFQLYKDYYDKGYLPQKWWTRNWDEYENGNIAQKSILTFHGPWQWDKIQAGNPEAGAQLDGFNWPASSDGKLYVTPTATFAFNTNAAALYTANKDKANAADAKKLFLWWHEPQTLKMVSEAIGAAPAFDQSAVGEAKLRHPQMVNVVQPTIAEGKLQYDGDFHGMDVAARYFKDGAENVMESDRTAAMIGDYLEGKTSLEDLMKAYQARWDAAYEVK